jgi:hypothetical protein
VLLLGKRGNNPMLSLASIDTGLFNGAASKFLYEFGKA